VSSHKEKIKPNIFKRIYTGQFKVQRSSLMLYVLFAAFVYVMCMVYMAIFIGNALFPDRPASIYTETVHYFLGVTLVLFGMCSKGMYLAVSRLLPERRVAAMLFFTALNLGFWALYLMGMYLDRVWAFLGD
jgi:hypothetical protein